MALNKRLRVIKKYFIIQGNPNQPTWYAQKSL